MHDYHVHSSYSDGEFLGWMVETAADAGLDGVGFADHCNVSERDHLQQYKRRFGFNLDVTYERRREAIEGLREEHDIRIYDAVEVDYHSADEAEIRAFLEDADFAVYERGTDPTDSDTDGDGYEDRAEVEAGTDPASSTGPVAFFFARLF